MFFLDLKYDFEHITAVMVNISEVILGSIAQQRVIRSDIFSINALIHFWFPKEPFSKQLVSS